MKSIKKIVVEVSQEQGAQPTLERALELCKFEPAQLYLFTCCYSSHLELLHLFDNAQMDMVAKALTYKQRQYLQALADDNSQDNLTMSVEAVWQTPRYQALIEYADRVAADMLISNLHADKATNRWALSASDSQLLKASPIPTLFVKSAKPVSHQGVMAALSPSHPLSRQSHLDDNLLSAGAQIAERIAGPLHACHCFDPNLLTQLVNMITDADIGKALFASSQNHPSHWKDKLKQQTHHAFQAHCFGMFEDQSRLHFVEGELIAQVQKLIEDNRIGILVVGSAYRTGLLGSSAEELLAHTCCDLLVVKPQAFESPVLA